MDLARKLVLRGVMRETDVPRLRELMAASPNKPLHCVILENRLAPEMDVLCSLAEELGMELVDLRHCTVSPEALAKIPREFMQRHKIVPLALADGTLVVATGDPYDVNSIDELHTRTGHPVMPVLASAGDIDHFIKLHFADGHS